MLSRHHTHLTQENVREARDQQGDRIDKIGHAAWILQRMDQCARHLGPENDATAAAHTKRGETNTPHEPPVREEGALDGTWCTAIMSE